jgi:hypothetical protein
VIDDQIGGHIAGRARLAAQAIPPTAKDPDVAMKQLHNVR